MKSRKKNKIKYSWTIQLGKSIPSFLWLVVFSLILAGIFTLRNPKTLPFHQIKITATGIHLKIPELNNIVIHHINGGFFSFNAPELRSALMALPWVYDVSIRRIWSSELEIAVAEKKPLARWNKTQLISKIGTLFTPPIATIPKDLPELQGPKGSEKIVLAQFEQFDRLLEPLHIKITALQVSDREAWFFVLNNHIQVYLGREDMDQRFEKLVRFYRQIIGNRSEQVEHIDLRYPNGLAVQWKSTHLP